jgi:hypothetical protein
LLGGEVVGELGVDGEGMPGEDGHAYAADGHAKIRNVQDLPGLIAELLLLVGFTGTVLDQ